MDKNIYIDKFNSYINCASTNYLGEVKLYDLINNFINEYHDFKQEYDLIPKLNLSSKMEYLFYNSNEHSNFKLLKLQLINPKEKLFENCEHILKLSYFEGEYKAIITNNKIQFDSDYKETNYNIDRNIIKKYLDLFEKYKALAETYYDIKKIFGGYFYSSKIALWIKLDGNLFTNIDNIAIDFGMFKTDFEINIDPSNLNISNISKIEDNDNKYINLSNSDIVDIYQSINVNIEDVKNIYIDYEKKININKEKIEKKLVKY